MAASSRREVRLQGIAATHSLRPFEAWAGLDRQSRVLYGALIASLVLHAVVLTLHFSFPEGARWKSADQSLEVVLVNAKTQERPVHAEVLAQANLDGGGDTDLERHAKTPLPVTQPRRPGRDLVEARRRVAQLEAEQRRLLAIARREAAAVPPKAQPHATDEQPTPRLSGRDLADLSLAAMQLQARIDRNIEAYEKRPRKKFLGARASEYRFAAYEEQWRQKVERVGTLNYPSGARGKLYGDLRLTVTIRPDGSVQSVMLDRSSGNKALDQAAFKIVHLAAPFQRFPPSIRKDTDLLVITRTWFFGQGDQFWTQ
jgi:periplasmic protein TonB